MQEKLNEKSIVQHADYKPFIFFHTNLIRASFNFSCCRQKRIKLNQLFCSVECFPFFVWFDFLNKVNQLRCVFTNFNFVCIQCSSYFFSLSIFFVFRSVFFLLTSLNLRFCFILESQKCFSFYSSTNSFTI